MGKRVNLHLLVILFMFWPKKKLSFLCLYNVASVPLETFLGNIQSAY